MAGLFIDPGALRHEFRLEAADHLPDGSGGSTREWVEIGIVFGLVEPVGAMTREAADRTTRTVSHRITVRHRADIAGGMRLTRNGRRFEVLTAHDPDESGRYLILEAREDVP